MATYNNHWTLKNKLKIDKRHLQFFANEIHNSNNKSNSSFMSKAYTEKNISCLLRREFFLLVPDVNTQIHGINSLKFKGSVLWNSLPANSKECQLILGFQPLLKQNEIIPCIYLTCRT